MMGQQFDLWSDADAGEREEQEEHLERVSSRIARAIIQFCRDHGRFHADELREWVVKETGIAAPASADRVLRDLRQRRVIDYVCLSRSESLYEVRRVGQIK